MIEILMWKYFGSLIFFIIAWLPLVIYMLVLQRFVRNASVSLDILTMASTFIGIILVGSVYIAMGCFASALTRSQLIAAAFSYGLVLTMFLLSMRSLVPFETRGWVGDFFSHISMTEHMQDFARGVLEISSMTYYLSLTAFFLFLTWKVVESRRWK